MVTYPNLEGQSLGACPLPFSFLQKVAEIMDFVPLLT